MERDRRVKIIGVPVSAVNLSSCIRYLKENFDCARGRYLCVSNVHTTVLAHDDPGYRRIQAESFLSLPDGKPLSVLGRRQAPGMDRVTGMDFFRSCLKLSGQEGYRHYFYGNRQENLQKLLEVIRRDYPQASIVGWEPSRFRDLTQEEADSLAERIRASGADFVWVGLGAPRQEIFCASLQGKTNAVMVGIGGVFDVMAGIRREAPRWMQNLCLEWLYRLLQEPRRLFKRYFVTNLRFIYDLLTDQPPREDMCRSKNKIDIH